MIMKENCLRTFGIRVLLFALVLFPIKSFGAVYDFTPTDGGLVVNLKPGDRILLSTWVDVNGDGDEDDGEEFFVCHYPSYTTGSYFGYTNWDGGKGNFLKLIPQDAGVTEPAIPSIWTIDEPVPFLYQGKTDSLDGIAYTMWSSNPDGESHTLVTSSGNSYKYQGDLTTKKFPANICNAVFVVPTNHSTVISFDPNKRLNALEGRDQDAQGRFNGEKGYGFLGLPYREVYWLDIPRGNAPVSYVNASVVGFNKTKSTIKYSNNESEAKPGQALYAFGNKDKHHNTPRTIFRLYVLDETTTSSCPNSYFFAFDEQDFVQYNKDFSKSPSYTTKKKIYTIDRLFCMEREGESSVYKTDLMRVPESDSAYFYVGYKNKYRNSTDDLKLGSGSAISQFTNIRQLRVKALAGESTPFIAPAGACGRMVADTTSNRNNLNVTFEPAGYFLRTSSGRNIAMVPNADSTEWTCEEMWTITKEFAALSIKATLFTGPDFRPDDPGADIKGWSVMVPGTEVPVDGGGSVIDVSGWARIYTNSSEPNGGMVFIPADADKYVHYNYNGHFGVELPDLHPKAGETTVVLEAPKLLEGYEFLYWTTNPDGTGDRYNAEQTVDLSEIAGGVLTLYAQAEYTGGISVAVSFVHPEDGKRYFITHPGTAPRFATARHFDEWTDTWQGMANVENRDPHYLSTYLLIGNNTVCTECADGEYVFDPRRETVHGHEDSITFYEHFQPDQEEYIGLYYTDPNTILANTTWAGLFQSSKGWPTPEHPCIDNTKLFSTNYLYRDGKGEIQKGERSNSDAPNIFYNTATGTFDGRAGEGMDFMISGVGVVDAHYVILPDTTTAWPADITFGYHTDDRTAEEVWSKLIGKHLLAQMTVGDRIVYFHPENIKTMTTATDLRLSLDYRLTQTFTYIRDARVEELQSVAADDKPQMREAGDEFARVIESGVNSPKDVIYNGNYIDICDTIRVRLRPMGTSRIKEYYGWWKEGAPGLHVAADGTRYRDIIVRTKTYHYGPAETKLVLTPELEAYQFSPLAKAGRQLNFTLTKVTSRQLLDCEGNVVDEEIFASEDVTSELHLASTLCSFTSSNGTSSSYFTISEAISDHITLVTKEDNTQGNNLDTLIIATSETIEGVSYPVRGRVPLMQAQLEGAELVWSVMDSVTVTRYFITAGTGGLIFRRYTQDGSTLKQRDTKKALIKGSKDAANSSDQYITPWKYTYIDPATQQLTLKTEYGVDMYFVVEGETPGETPGVASAGPATLTYEYTNVYVNSNANFEEQVKLRFGADKWLKFTGGETPSLTLTTNKNEASVFSWGYLLQEYSLLNNGTYPDHSEAEFGYNSLDPVQIKTRYKAYKEYSMLLDNKVVYCCREDENDIADLIDEDKEWKTNPIITQIHDRRFAEGASGLSITTNRSNLTTTITPEGDSPAGTTNVVDTLDVVISLQPGAPEYRFKDKWSSFTSVDDAHLKIPLIRKAYHQVPFDSVLCMVENDEYNFAFSSTGKGTEHEFTLHTLRHIGENILDVDNHVVSSIRGSETDLTEAMDLTSIARAEVRLIDEYGNTPSWCEISDRTSNTITMRCKENGIRSPRVAYLYFAYVVNDGSGDRYVNFRLSVSQASLFKYGHNQTLHHSEGASGDPKDDKGMQQVHENRRILYYYNPAATAYADQDVELPVRERSFYGWWRWFNLTPGSEDQDIADEYWVAPPRNTGKYNYPYRIIGDSVPDGKGGKKLVTQGRYTVFQFPSRNYGSKTDPPAKSPLVVPPTDKKTVTYAVELSNYTDNLPLSMKYVNQIDTARLDTMEDIIEPTLSLREIFELRPWTEMAAQMENYKSAVAATYENEKYMEDHEIMAPTGNRLLLNTEQRYNYDNLRKGGHSESLMGYYMRDDNWETGGWSDDRKDTMIWVAGWDAEALWYTYNPKTKTYTRCAHRVTEGDDFLDVPAKSSIAEGREADTVYYCLRARSKKTTTLGTLENPDPDKPDSGDYYFNICRWKVIYHRPAKYGPMQENKVGGVDKAIITNDEIEQNYEVLEYLDFDYNKPGSDYQVYPHPLPWADATYGYSYPKTPALPDNRYHNDFAENFPNGGEYGIINRIPYSNFWHKMEQHGGAENGYMIYCDGMASAGQVAAISLETQLCEGQQMFFSGYVGNPSSQKDKANPNFLFSVQGWDDKADKWVDVTSYMTGDIQPSNKWSQIYFPINTKGSYEKFRVRIYNMASNFDGNDFIIDDMRIFASKPPLIAYQANTTCVEEGESDSLTHVVLRVDYQGFNNDEYNGKDVYYTVHKVKGTDTTFVPMVDGYINERIVPHKTESPKRDTIYGQIKMPPFNYEPQHDDSIFSNLADLIYRFEHTDGATKFRMGYIYENVDDSIRPVLYVIHKAVMTAEANKSYKVRMSLSYRDLHNSICAMTSDLKVSNRMTLVLNGEEEPENVVVGMCANTTYDISLRVKGSLLRDSLAPADINGSCMDDWLLYADTTDAKSLERYGYKYKDIKKVLTEILRCDPEGTTNANQFARNLSEVSRNEMVRIQGVQGVTLSDGVVAYTLLSDLVNRGFLTLYQSKMTATIASGDSVQYMIFPIVGTGSDAMLDMAVEVCPTPVFVKLKPTLGGAVPMKIGGFARTEAEEKEPAVILADQITANSEIAIPVDTMDLETVLDTVVLLSTNDPEYRKGIHFIRLLPDIKWELVGMDRNNYYKAGDTIKLSPAPNSNYRMRPGYNYTFTIQMMTRGGSPTLSPSGCAVGSVPFTLSVVPDYVRWDPKSENGEWNNPDNWVGINQQNQPIHEDAHFVPLATTSVVIPPMTDGLPYPELTDPEDVGVVKKTGYQYNTCDSIRFMPGTAMANQQLLNYNGAVVDMKTPHETWALRSAPVTGMLSGDVFISNADQTWHTTPWEVGPFDARGRNATTGNASFWLSQYNRSAVHKGNNFNEDDTNYTAAADWTRVTNGMNLSLPAAYGWAIYTRTASEQDAIVRLPKNDDVYYYYTRSGEKVEDMYEHNLRSKRDTEAGGSGKAGKLAYKPTTGTQSYTLSNAVDANMFVFGNPTMGYIDIWGFIADNSLKEEIDYINSSGGYVIVSKSTALDSKDTITNPQRYLPPMHAMVVKMTGETTGTSLEVHLDTTRVVTKVSQVRPLSAPRRANAKGVKRGIMTVTAVNPASSRCTSRLLIGQGYHAAVIDGEDAMLTTVNIDNYSNTSAPATPFNIYASEGGYGLSIDLRDEVMNVPISFYMSELPFEPVTHLWFTGVNNIDGTLVLYDALMESEREIVDGIRIDIETPPVSHQARYYIRRKGFTPGEGPTNPITTGSDLIGGDEVNAIKIVKDGHVLILRDGHVYTMLGQQIQ